MQLPAYAIDLGLVLLKPSPGPEAKDCCKVQTIVSYPKRRLSWDLLLNQMEISCVRKAIYQKPSCHRVKCPCVKMCGQTQLQQTLFLLEELLLGQVCLISVLHCSVCCIYLILLVWPSLLLHLGTHELDFHSCSLLKGGKLMQSLKREMNSHSVIELADTVFSSYSSTNLNCCGWLKHNLLVQ